MTYVHCTVIMLRTQKTKYYTLIKRKILLLIDNAPSHILGDLVLSNVTVHFLPPNTTSKIQPLDAGIISAFKRRYRSYQLEEALARDEAGNVDIYKVDQFQAMKWSLAAWDQISARTIANCWRHCKILSPRKSDGTPETVTMGKFICVHSAQRSIH